MLGTMLVQLVLRELIKPGMLEQMLLQLMLEITLELLLELSHLNWCFFF